MASLLLLRHGQSTWNAERRWQGWEDAPLSDAGRAQARAMAAELAGPGNRFTRVVSSDLARSVDTARILADALGLGEVEEDAGLRERDVGHWSGRTTDEIEEGWPGAIDEWRAGRLDRPPGGELEPVFRARVVAAVERLAASADGPVLVVTHGGVVRAVQRHLGIEPKAVNNLCGRWVHVAAGRLVVGDEVALPSAEEEAITTAL